MEFEKIKAPKNLDFQTTDTQPQMLFDSLESNYLLEPVTEKERIRLTKAKKASHLAEPLEEEDLFMMPESHIQQNLTENASLSAHSQRQYPATPVTNTAQNSPQQQLPPAQKTWKQKKSDASHLKEVRKRTHSHTEQGDLTSYAIRQNLIQKQKADAQKKKIPDYKKDYSSEPVEVKNAFLERFTHEMLNIPLSMDMFTDEYMAAHTADLKELYDRISAFRSLKAAPENRDFFDRLPDIELLNVRMEQLDAFAALVDNRFACKCINLSGEYNSPDEQSTALLSKDRLEDEFIYAAQAYTNKKQKLEQVQEQNPQYEKPEEIFTLGNTIKLSREEAVSSHSDQLSRTKREELNDILSAYTDELKELSHIEAVMTAVENYIKGDRYTVGYTEERQLLKTALSAIKTAKNTRLPIEKVNLSKYVREFLNRLNTYFEGVTNGTLVCPDDLELSENPKDIGSINRGSHRNALIRGFSHWSDQRDTPLFSHEPTINDLKQRTVSNCYMVAATAGLVDLAPELLKECLKDNHDGTVTVRLYQRKSRPAENPAASENAQALTEAAGDAELDDFLKDLEIVNTTDTEIEYEPVYVRVSKEIPRIGWADSLSAGALWMQMIEKACAVLGRGRVKGYKSLWYGEGGEFLERLLGITPDPPVQLSKLDQTAGDTLFQEICNAGKNRKIFSTGTKGSVNSKDGLNAGHAYTIMGGKLIDGKRYVLLRNPYSTMSLEYKEDGSVSRTGHMLDDSDETYGQFYMKYEEFLQKFQSVTCTDLNKKA